MKRKTRKLTLDAVLFHWFFCYLGLLFLNGATVKSPLLVQAAGASLGLFLLCVPVAPAEWELRYGAARARTAVQIAAAVQILFCFLFRVRF